jgi:hypothetical protein
MTLNVTERVGASSSMVYPKGADPDVMPARITKRFRSDSPIRVGTPGGSETTVGHANTYRPY